MPKTVNCYCQKVKFENKDSLLEEFALARNKCVALKKILVPDSVWSQFEDKTKESPDTVRHNYKILGAFQHGILSKITYPIHRYLMDQNQPLKTLQKSYKKELIESWMMKRSPLERHQKARGHEGKINELLCAVWIEKKGWKIENLEALGGKFDIEATSTENILYSIEIKFIGEEDKTFEQFEQCCITGDAVGGTIPIYDGYNYFLFRTYEAALQLSKSNRKCLAIIVFSNRTWDFNAMPVKDGWISNHPIKFSDSASKGWDAFINNEDNKKKHPDIYKKLEECITTNIDELWVMRQLGNLEYCLEEAYKF